jgi:hypothetical protein
MKYRVHKSTVDESFDVITEDGGIASVYYNDFNLVTNYYEANLNEINKDNYLWDELSNARIYCHDWEEGVTNQEVIQDALDWLNSQVETWELDNTIYQDVLNDDI